MTTQRSVAPPRRAPPRSWLTGPHHSVRAPARRRMCGTDASHRPSHSPADAEHGPSPRRCSASLRAMGPAARGTASQQEQPRVSEGANRMLLARVESHRTFRPRTLQSPRKTRSRLGRRQPPPQLAPGHGDQDASAQVPELDHESSPLLLQQISALGRQVDLQTPRDQLAAGRSFAAPRPIRLVRSSGVLLSAPP
jgi:hypothetical protein